ncbi:hypothetical protein [Streptomyces mirabilis]
MAVLRQGAVLVFVDDRHDGVDATCGGTDGAGLAGTAGQGRLP